MFNSKMSIISMCDDSSIIKCKKYKTIGELKSASMPSIIQTLARMDKCPERDYLDKWLFDTHYVKKEMDGNLTMRIAHINNTICYREIMKRCFNDVDILSNKTTKSILETSSIEFIKELHAISSSMLGTFIDYLIRRIISELLGNLFEDNRARGMSNSIGVHICSSTINYSEMTNKQLKELCKIKGVIGYSAMNKDAMVNVLNVLAHKCKYTVKSVIYLNECELPICQNLCYEKAKNTVDYKTCDIVTDILVTSLFHSEAFGGAPKQEEFDKFYEKLRMTDNISNILINPLIELCKVLILDKKDVLLNPILGGPLDDLDVMIPSDADIVINDTLIDIKCTIGKNDISEINQLLGYSSLLMLNKRYRIKINTIMIINILQGNIISYNIDFINKDNCLQYIKILTNNSGLVIIT